MTRKILNARVVTRPLTSTVVAFPRRTRVVVGGKTSEVNRAVVLRTRESGVQSVDGRTGAVTLSDLYDPLGAANDAVADHVAAADPHPGYLTPAEADAAYEPLGTAASEVAAHVAAADPHTGYQKESEKGAANGYCDLDSNQKVPTSRLPGLALTDVSLVNSEAAQLALTAEEGDVAVRSDIRKSYAHNGGTAGTMADWQELYTPTDTVSSVDGRTGVVTLTDLYADTDTQVIAGAGLTGGGTLAADRTLTVGAGTGITVNADDVALDTAHARNVDHTAVTLTAGDGLSGGGDISASRSFAVNVDGSTIEISGDSLQVKDAGITRAKLSGGLIQTVRTTTGSIAAGAVGATVSVTWGSAFPDSNYTCQGVVEDSPTNNGAIRLHHLVSKTTTGATFHVVNDALGFRTGTLHAIAIHD